MQLLLGLGQFPLFVRIRISTLYCRTRQSDSFLKKFQDEGSMPRVVSLTIVCDRGGNLVRVGLVGVGRFIWLAEEYYHYG